MRALDRGDATDRLDPGTPSNQILRYLSAVEIASERAIRWGILTNGAVWRLYYQGARSRSEEFLELDIAGLLQVPGTQADLEFGGDARHSLKLFFCLFRRDAFLTQPWDSDGRTFHEYALAEARRYEERVSQDLGQRVFDTVFPDLANALASGDPKGVRPLTREYLNEVREAALILLYRLLFVLYAEDRGLLPVRDPRYFNYSLRRVREDIQGKREKNFAFSTQASRIWDDLKSLFGAIANGDSALGLPAYNGGLFEDERTPLLSRARVSDAQLAPAIDEVSRRAEHTLRAWINYRDLSVQHLGGIYERLLEYRLEPGDTRLVARPTSFARRGSGSYYTHDDLVKLLIDQAVGPLVTERVQAFGKAVTKHQKKLKLAPGDWEALDAIDPGSRILELKVCDPAMGSGHFLVALVDYVADTVLEQMSNAAETVAAQRWAKDVANPWVSPVASRIADIRNRILKAGREQGWAIDPAQLDDRHVVRRMILKRMIHGVDKNPMAVELSKVALWLHTFTVGAPLSFLDHHLRCGDALFGGRIWQLTDELGKLKGAVQQQLNIADGSIRQIETDKGTVTRGLLQYEDLRRIEQARMTMQAIGDLTDIDIAEAHQSKALMDQIEESLLPLKRGLDFLQAMRWASKDDAKGYAETWADLLSQEFGEDLLESLELLAKRGIRPHGERQKRAHRVVQSALTLANEVRFLHWELAFPTVWSRANGSRSGGFDAVIGNPPWDRMKLQEVEWFAERKPEIAKAVRAADRKRMITQLEETDDPLWQEYAAARDMAETATRIARESGDYPLLSGGDVNLYSLFVERASSLIQPAGMVGLLTPSGIGSDKGASEFFGGIAGGGRLAALFDFENKKVFFPDIHASFKFSALVFCGEDRSIQRTHCAFYLHGVSELALPERVLTLSAEDFRIVNPNTGGAPVFRTRRDAEITTAIYRHQPVLVDRRTNPPLKVWPVRYLTMFHMTNDSKLFKRRDELERAGWYPVAGNRWKKGNAEMLPLYEGKMVQMYDHRAANVVVHSDNLHRAAQQEAVSLQHHEDPRFVPAPQFWIAKSEVTKEFDGDWTIGFKDVTAPTNVHTMIASIVPQAGYGNTLPILSTDADAGKRALFEPLLLANLNSLALDYLARQKVQGQHLNWYIVEQFPMIRPDQFEARIGRKKIADFVHGEVLRLSYTAHDLEPFARDLGYDGPPFNWDEDDRRHRMARLDALFFQLYGISREDAAYILDTFPIVRQEDEKAFGRYLTKDLVLAYMNAVAAGDLSSVVNV
ncbi:MAG: restriction endonuclease [Betaproteobacteria bacterium]|nr:restriction endonuclease [Betaproteobacteria bacterium]